MSYELATDLSANFLTSALEAAAGAAGGAVTSWTTGDTFDAYKDFLNNVARTVANVTPGATPEDTVNRILAAGYIPIYCNDSEKTRDDIVIAFENLGWVSKPWSQKNNLGFSRTSWHYGTTYKLTDAPRAVVARAKIKACLNLTDYTNELLKFAADAKAYLQGNDAPNWEDLIARIVPVAPTACTGLMRTIPYGSGAGAKPFYKTWWFWTLIGTATVGATTAVVVILKRKK